MITRARTANATTATGIMITSGERPSLLSFSSASVVFSGFASFFRITIEIIGHFVYNKIMIIRRGVYAGIC